ncbi:MAG TPA: chloride channel protein [Candidatus Methylomirabilis sp.]|nr:chloride channel protein [Candidatus Methylomirabilis sp.]
MGRVLTAWRRRWRRLGRRLQVAFLRASSLPRIPKGAYAILLAILVGLLTGLGAVGFIRLLQILTYLSFQQAREPLSFLGRFYVVLLPAAGGLIVGPLIYYFAREAKGHGVPEVMTAIVVSGGRIRKRVALVKILASAITIGSGGSAGREGPMIQIGAGVGSSVAQLLRMSDDRIKTFLACGAAGGVSATFNAPIAGAMFALEVLGGQFGLDFSLVVLASVTSAVVSRAMLGNFPSFQIPPWDMVSEKEFVFYLLLGLLAAGAATLFVRTLSAFEDWFDGWNFPEWLKPAIGGLAVGIIGVWLPQVFGSGLPQMEQVLLIRYPLVIMLLLVPAKVLATSLTLGSGGSGGVFAPSLFIGGMLGGAFGHLVHLQFPTFTAFSAAYAIVGMAAVFGAAAQAPITAIIIIFEMTGDYHIILPLMASTVIAASVYRAFNANSIYTIKLRKRGIIYREGQDLDIMTATRVAAAMTHRLLSVPPDMSIRTLRLEAAKNHHTWFPVVNNGGELVGVITAQDAARAMEGGEEDVSLEKYMTREIVSVTPLDTLHEVVRRFGVRDLGHLPVVDLRNPRKLLGIISRAHVLRAYNRELARRQAR